MNTLDEFTAAWRDTEESHRAIHDLFCAKVNADPELKAHRDYIEAGCWGFGERSFHWLWRLIVKAVPPVFSALEIGVHRGQVLSLWRLLMHNGWVVGVSPFDGRDTGEEHDYRNDVIALHKHFGQREPILITGDSTRPETLGQFKDAIPFNIVYIDGCHLKSAVTSDILNYAPMVAPGGYLVCDDSGTRLNMPWGYFRGHQEVSDAVDELLPPFGPQFLPGGSQWRHLGNVVHNRVWQRM